MEELGKYHQMAGKMSLDNALSGIPEQVPMHPGAAKYYKEKGVWTTVILRVSENKSLLNF
jgi:TRAP-type uncharacterized transport system substrate-binding protein